MEGVGVVNNNTSASRPKPKSAQATAPAKAFTKWTECGSVCLLCLKTRTHTSVKCDLDKYYNSRLACIRYVTLISKYLHLECELSTVFQKSFALLKAASSANGSVSISGDEDEVLAPIRDCSRGKEASKLVLCENCESMAETFCQTYQLYEMVRLELQKALYDATTLIDKVNESNGNDFFQRTNRGLVFKRNQLIPPPKDTGSDKVKCSPVNSTSSVDEDILVDFRQKLKSCGELRMKSSKPRVLLKRKHHPSSQTTSTSAPCNVPGPSTPAQVKSSQPPITTNPASIVQEKVIASTSTPSLNTFTVSNSIPTVTTTQAPQTSFTINRVQENVLNANVLPITFKTPPPPSLMGTSMPTMTMVSQTQSQIASPKTLTSAIASFISANPCLVQQNPVIIVRNVQNGGTMPNSGIITPSTTTPISSIVGQPTVPVSTPAPQLPQQYLGTISTNEMAQVQIGTLQCNIDNCGMTFTNTQQGQWCMHSHFKNSHNHLPCSKCSYIAKFPTDLIKHEQKHTVTDTSYREHGFNCSRCFTWSPNLAAYKEHFFLQHFNTKIDLLKCSECKKGFSLQQQDAYEEHIRTVHSITIDNLNACSCYLCLAIFKDERALYSHLKIDHNINCKQGGFACKNEHCSLAFFTHDLLNLHTKLCKRVVNNYTCPVPDCQCEIQEFDSFFKLKRHVTQTHPTFVPLECLLCHRKFYCHETLTHHLNSSPNCNIAEESSSLQSLEVTNFDPKIVSVSSSISCSNNDSTPVVVNQSQIQDPKLEVKPEVQKSTQENLFLSERDEDEEEMIDQEMLMEFCNDNAAPIEDPFAWLTSEDLPI